MDINCELQTNGDYICNAVDTLPEYITLQTTATGNFFYSEVITTTDILLVFFFILFLIIFITKGLFNFIFRKIIFMKQKI